MDFLNLDPNWVDPNKLDFEAVERKGLGHPDTLADGLAEAVSSAFSKYCLDNFGAVLHHNVDKLYIGRGHFIRDFGSYKMLKPVEVSVNGRMSNMMYGNRIDIEKIQYQAVSEYLEWALPHLDVEKQANIITNANQYTLKDFWFKPRNLEDVPDAFSPVANDTSMCVAHYPFSVCEELAYRLERYFWREDDSGKLFPRYDYTGQDIKVMVQRKQEEIDVTLCVPLMSKAVKSPQDYHHKIQQVEHEVREYANLMVSDSPFKLSLSLNPKSEIYKNTFYMLSIGSCIECGEEGLVGRGNSINGVISITRPRSMEAFPGKNPVYHTGRVHGLLSYKLAKSIYENLKIPCSVYVLTKSGQSLIPPYSLTIQLPESEKISRPSLEKIIEEHFLNVDYLKELIKQSHVK